MRCLPTYVVLGTVLLLSGGLLFIDGWAHAAGSERLSFTSNRGGIFDIYVMDIDGKNLRNVTNHPSDHFGPWATISEPAYTWSPDGRFLAYVSKRDGDWKIYAMDTRTQEHWRLTNRRESEWAPAWSPDGKRIAYVFSDTILWQTADIYIIDAEGNRRGRPLVEGARQDLSPAWVPEGFLSVSPSAEKLMTLWGRLKQTDR